MKIFLSWSGPRSKRVADILGEWLSQVIQAVEPWISSDIDKGARWSSEVATQLEQADFGIICLTKENLTAPWLLFESGALAKHRDGRVCTFLLDVAPTDVKQPLAQFQATSLAREEVMALVETVNARLDIAGERALTGPVLEKIVNRLWPDLERDLEEVKNQPSESVGKANKRSSDDIMLEVLSTVRRMEALFQSNAQHAALKSLFDDNRDRKDLVDVNERLAMINALRREYELMAYGSAPAMSETSSPEAAALHDLAVSSRAKKAGNADLTESPRSAEHIGPMKKLVIRRVQKD